MQNGSLKPLRLLKISNFTNPKWRTAAILKTVKSPYLCSRLTDFDQIWHDDVYLPPTAEKSLKFCNFLKFKMAAAAIWKITKIAIYRNGLTDLYEIWYIGAKWVS